MKEKNIVVGIDFSAGSEQAAKVALDLARHHGARLHLVYAGAVPDPIDPDSASDPTASSFSQLVSALTASEFEQARRELAEMRERLEKQGADVSQAIIDGPAATALPKAARELSANLLVVGSHGRTGLERFLMGSVAEHVVRSASCPVLVVRASLPPGGAQKVMVGVDFSECSERAVHALPLCAARDAKVELVHAWAPPIGGFHYASPGTGFPLSEGADLRRWLAEAAATRGAELLKKVAGRDGNMRFDAVEGNAADMILRRSEAHNCDLITVGSQGRSGLGRLLLGSVAERVVRHARCSVLIVR